jgi:hypothetical protein
MKIFISYRREDSAGHTGRLYDSLEAHFGAENLFMDLSAIESGQNFVDAIKTAVGSCDALIAVIGKQWLTCTGPDGRRLDDPRDFVRAEIGAALERGTPVVPVLVEGATMPPVEALPDALKPLAERLAHELSDQRWSYDIGRLIEATEKLGGAPRRWERRTWLSLAATAALVAILAAAFLFRPPPLPNVRLAGEWSAQVAYSWGGKYTERFSFTLDGDEVLGTASFLGVRRGIRDGTLSGDRVLFNTSTQEVSGDWQNPKDVVHHYRGRISGDLITFSMLSEDGSSNLPVEFTARREPEGATP